jgi:hypothetical protein
MTFDDIPSAVGRILDRLDILEERINALPSYDTRYWWTLRQACERKGVSYEVVRKRPRRYWPNRGQGHPVVNNGGHYSEMYSYTEVMEWLPKTEAEIDAEIRWEASAS